MTWPTVSVVICAYTLDRWDDLLHAVESVRRQGYAAREIVVVVDHNAELLERLRKIGDIVAIENPHRRGLSGARNAGTAAAGSEIVAFLDDDAAARPDWLETLAPWYEDADTAGVGGRSVAKWDGGRPGWFPVEFDWVVGSSYLGMPTAPHEVRNFIGSNMSFRQSLLTRVGGFAEQLGRVGANAGGAEETELCIRMRRLVPHASLVYDPRAVVAHRVRRQRATVSYYLRRCFGEGRSKAVVARREGRHAALATELDYAGKVLPRSAAGYLRTAAGGRLGSLAPAAAIAVGFGATCIGYAFGTFATSRRKSIG